MELPATSLVAKRFDSLQKTFKVSQGKNVYKFL